VTLPSESTLLANLDTLRGYSTLLAKSGGAIGNTVGALIAAEASNEAATLRDSAVSFTDTLDANGRITQRVYTLTDPPGTITDTAVYGTNSVAYTRGAFVSSAPIAPTLSNFAINSAGTQLTYTVSGAAVTALTGTLLGTDTADRTLTHVSSGVATISGSPMLNNDTGITVTIASSTPTLASAVTGVAVTNNSQVGVAPTISNFAINAAGTQLTYTVSGAPITALTATLLGAAGGTRTLTHVSSGVASISGAAILQGATGLTLTVSASTPTLASAVTGAAVTNGSTVTGITLTPITWTTANGLTQSGSSITLAATNSGGLSTPTINSANPFEIVVTMASNAAAEALVVLLDDENSANFTWTTTNPMIMGVFTITGNLTSCLQYSGGGAGTNQNHGAVTFPYYSKLKKSGSDLLLQGSTDGINYTTLRTRAGILTGQTLYLKTLLAAGSNKGVDVKLYL
jgi:hypothetical protein